MSRFDYCDDSEPYPNAWALHERATENALAGRRGQAVLQELEAALLSLPERRLISGALCRNGGVCAVGALALKRELEAGKQIAEALAYLETVTSEEAQVGETARFAEKHLGMLKCVAHQLAYQNDEAVDHRTSGEERHRQVLEWVRSKIRKEGSWAALK